MIIDFHTHCFSDLLAPKAMANLAKNSLYPPHFDGTLNGLKNSMKEAKIDYSIVLNIATNPHQTTKVNDWAISTVGINGIIPFGSINPFYDDFKSEIQRLKENGVVGIKFHPDYQDYFVDDKIAYPLYEEIAKNDMIMSFHCGHDLVLREPYHCTSEMFSHLVRDFPGAKLVGAHLGGQGLWNEVFEFLAGTDVYLDTSFGFKFMTKEEIARFVTVHDNSKILFATDSPWQKQSVEVDEMRQFIADPVLLNKIFYENAAKLLKLKI